MPLLVLITLITLLPRSYYTSDNLKERKGTLLLVGATVCAVDIKSASGLGKAGVGLNQPPVKGMQRVLGVTTVAEPNRMYTLCPESEKDLEVDACLLPFLPPASSLG